MGYCLFSARKVVLKACINDMNYALTTVSNRQMAISTQIAEEQQKQAISIFANQNNQNQVTGSQDQATTAKMARLNACDKKLSAEQKRLETQMKAMEKELEAVEKAEDEEIKSSHCLSAD